MKKNMTFSERVKKHKKAIIIGTGLVVGVGGGLIWKNWNSLSDFIEACMLSRKENASLKEASYIIPILDEDTKMQDIITIPVNGFRRNLQEGQRPSPLKVATAVENGFELGENQTWVRPYVKTKVA